MANRPKNVSKDVSFEKKCDFYSWPLLRPTDEGAQNHGHADKKAACLWWIENRDEIYASYNTGKPYEGEPHQFLHGGMFNT